MTLWCLERSLFQTVVKSAGQEKDEERLNILKGVKDLKDLPEEKLRKISDCLEEEYFETGNCIIRQEMIIKSNEKLRQKYVVFKLNVPKSIFPEKRRFLLIKISEIENVDQIIW